MCRAARPEVNVFFFVLPDVCTWAARFLSVPNIGLMPLRDHRIPSPSPSFGGIHPPPHRAALAITYASSTDPVPKRPEPASCPLRCDFCVFVPFVVSGRFKKPSVLTLVPGHLCSSALPVWWLLAVLKGTGSPCRAGLGYSRTFPSGTRVGEVEASARHSDHLGADRNRPISAPPESTCRAQECRGPVGYT